MEKNFEYVGDLILAKRYDEALDILEHYPRMYDLLNTNTLKGTKYHGITKESYMRSVLSQKQFERFAHIFSDDNIIAWYKSQPNEDCMYHPTKAEQDFFAGHL